MLEWGVQWIFSFWLYPIGVKRYAIKTVPKSITSLKPRRIRKSNNYSKVTYKRFNGVYLWLDYILSTYEPAPGWYLDQTLIIVIKLERTQIDIRKYR